MNLNQVTISSTNFETAVLFYQQLGLKLIVLSEGRYARFECPNGDATFSIHLTDKPLNNNSPTLYFECNNLDSEVQRLKSQNIIFELDPTDQEWLWREAHLRDPDGHKIILYFAGKNRKNPPWKIS